MGFRRRTTEKEREYGLLVILAYFRRDRAPTLDEIVYFLELEQAKDITVTDMHELNRFDVP